MNTPQILSIGNYLQTGTADAVRTVIYHSEERELVLWQIPPQARLPAHRHLTGTDIWVVLQGEAELTDGEDSGRIIRCGDCIVSTPQTVHGAVNRGQTDCVLVSTVSPDIGYEAV